MIHYEFVNVRPDWNSDEYEWRVFVSGSHLMVGRSGLEIYSMNRNLKFLDVFAGAGGLSEGFIQAGFEPVAHVESEQAACFTLRTRMAYHWLKSCDRTQLYSDYLNRNLSREYFYEQVPEKVTKSIINSEISASTLPDIFKQIDTLLGNQRLDLIVGGPPCQAYSTTGRSRDGSRMKGDIRNYLYIYYAEFLTRYRPTYFVFENVTGLLSARDKDGNLHFDTMRRLFKSCGYETEFMVLSANDLWSAAEQEENLSNWQKG